MKTRLSVVIIVVAVMALLVVFVLNAPRQEIRPKEAVTPPQEKEIESTASKYKLPSAVRTERLEAPKPAEQVAAPTQETKKITAKQTPAPAQTGESQKDTYTPRKYPSDEKMRQMQERGIVLY